MTERNKRLAEFKLGDRVTASARLFRSVRADGKREWVKFDILPRCGSYIGYRDLSNGNTSWDNDNFGFLYKASERFRVALVVFSERENPIRVPVDAIEKLIERES